MSRRFRFLGLFPVFFIILLLAQSIFAAPKEKEVNIEGTVKAITSPFEFEVGHYSVVCSDQTKMTLTYAKREVTDQYDPAAIRVGMKIKIEGKHEVGNSRVSAEKLAAPAYEDRENKIDGTALIEKLPALEKKGERRVGTIYADGRVINVTPGTEIEFAPSRSERKHASGRPVSSLKSLDEVGPNVYMSYKGLPAANGTINATRLVFTPNERDPEFLRWRNSDRLTVTEPENSGEGPGKVVIAPLSRPEKAEEFLLVSSRALQEQVNRIGLQLVPAFLKALPKSDPTKLEFRVFVVESEKPVLKNFPDGKVLVSTRLIRTLQNEAQLAAVLGFEVALVVQGQIYQQPGALSRRDIASTAAAGGTAAVMGALGAVPIGAPAWVVFCALNEARCDNSSLSRVLSQATRLALEHMLDAGYDPLQGEKAFSLLSKKEHSGKGMSSKERRYFDFMALVAHHWLSGFHAEGRDALTIGSEEYKKLLGDLPSVAPVSSK